jgi:HK97 family phage portal protein
MRFLSWLGRNAADVNVSEKQLPIPITGDRGRWWHPVIREPFTGAWQRNMELRTENVLSYSAVFSCITLIASDVGKLRIKLVEQDRNGIWSEVNRDSPFWPVLRKPNNYQNRITFLEQWIVSKLINGNTYVLKERDNRGVVVALHILDPNRVRPLQADNGDIYYDLGYDVLAGVGTGRAEDQTKVPASEIIHDLMVPLYHPLCGVSPLTASFLAAAQGMNIQQQSVQFFANKSSPGGVLTAPGHIGDDVAERLTTYFEAATSGANVGRVVVAGDGLKFERLTMTAIDAQLIEQLKLSAEIVCSTFHVPPHMVGVGQPPSYNNIEALNQQYYSQCLQKLIEKLELSLDEGLSLTTVPGKIYGTELDLDGLLRMDSATQMEVLTKATGTPVMEINAARKKLDLPPIEGGESIWMQQQNYSLEALSERDKNSPLLPAPAPQPVVQPTDEQAQIEAAALKQFGAWQLDSCLRNLPPVARDIAA